jgi:hypothetical protein
MGKTLLYQCSKKYSEVQLVKRLVKADKHYIDLANERGWSSYQEFNNLVGEIQEGDKVILPSIVMVSADLDEVYKLLSIFRDKGVELTLINPIRGEETFLTDEGFKALQTIFNLRKDLTKNKGVIEIKAENQIKQRDSKEVFPEGFYQVFEDFKNKGLKAETAAKKLGIDVHKYYRLVREFG